MRAVWMVVVTMPAVTRSGRVSWAARLRTMAPSNAAST